MKDLNVALTTLLFLLSGGAIAQPSPSLTDPQIAAITVAANQVDIDAGQMAKSRASNPEVKAFAQQMITDHTGVNKSANDLVKKLNMKPEENTSSTNLKNQGQETMKRLKDMKGAEFDRAYIDNEVTFHQTVLDTIDKSLLPNAKNDELKALLTKVRPNIAAHLDHAKQIQASLGKKGS